MRLLMMRFSTFSPKIKLVLLNYYYVKLCYIFDISSYMHYIFQKMVHQKPIWCRRERKRRTSSSNRAAVCKVKSQSHDERIFWVLIQKNFRCVEQRRSQQYPGNNWSIIPAESRRRHSIGYISKCELEFPTSINNSTQNICTPLTVYFRSVFYARHPAAPATAATVTSGSDGQRGGGKHEW